MLLHWCIQSFVGSHSFISEEKISGFYHVWWSTTHVIGFNRLVTSSPNEISVWYRKTLGTTLKTPMIKVTKYHFQQINLVKSPISYCARVWQTNFGWVRMSEKNWCTIATRYLFNYSFLYGSGTRVGLIFSHSLMRIKNIFISPQKANSLSNTYHHSQNHCCSDCNQYHIHS